MGYEGGGWGSEDLPNDLGNWGGYQEYPDWASRHQNYTPGQYNPQEQTGWYDRVIQAHKKKNDVQGKDPIQSFLSDIDKLFNPTPTTMTPGEVFPMPSYAMPNQVSQQAPHSMDNFMNFTKFMQTIGPMLYGGGGNARSIGF